MSEEPLKHIAIVGAGVELWFSAAFLAATLKPFNISVTSIELQSVNGSALEALAPQSLRLLQLLKINEFELIRQCRAGYSLGLDCNNEAGSFFIPYGGLGFAAQDGTLITAAYRSFFQSGKNNLDTLSLAATVAQQGKFAIAGADRPDLQKLLRYGVQLEVAGLTDLMRSHCNKLGITCLSSKGSIGDVTFDDGHITSFTCLPENNSVHADFWIDLTVDGVLRDPAESTAMLTGREEVETLFVAQTWQKASPKNAARVISATSDVLKSSYRSADVEQNTFYSNSQDKLLEECSKASYKNFSWHMTEQSSFIPDLIWQKNCLSLGCVCLNVSGPTYSRTDLTLAALVQFVDQLPDADIKPELVCMYNRNMSDYFSEIISFNSSIFGMANIQVGGSSEARQRKDVFFRTGRLLPNVTDAIDAQQWQCLLYGLLGVPALPDVTLDRVGSDDVNEALSSIQSKVASVAATMPGYADFLTRLLSRHI
ncbi:tryptophan 7-halogenase [Gilvimarinus polysaccharolyticus]|uniref:tryptophan 7-halogenase n=1 Tax=Gilvimarinus polysaccharolyticus TaxID=863921 RepID=UPI000673C111|nr:tryptophan 7-halogenase [Gilvimarinus polysaccharolyticus]